MEARFKAINAAGGIDGRKITWVVDDTTSTPAGAETAAKDLVENKGVFAIAELSSAFYGAAPYLAQAGIPVTGVGLDGPEWSQQPNTNLFSTTGNCLDERARLRRRWLLQGHRRHQDQLRRVQRLGGHPAGEQRLRVHQARRPAGVRQDHRPHRVGELHRLRVELQGRRLQRRRVRLRAVLQSRHGHGAAPGGAEQGQDHFRRRPHAATSTRTHRTRRPPKSAYFPGIVSSPTYTNAASLAFLAQLKKYDPRYKGGLPDLGSGRRLAGAPT